MDSSWSLLSHRKPSSSSQTWSNLSVKIPSTTSFIDLTNSLRHHHTMFRLKRIASLRHQSVILASPHRENIETDKEVNCQVKEYGIWSTKDARLYTLDSFSKTSTWDQMSNDQSISHVKYQFLSLPAPPYCFLAFTSHTDFQNSIATAQKTW